MSLNLDQLAHNAWSIPDQMRVLADYLIENEEIKIDNGKDIHSDDRSKWVWHDIEMKCRRWIFRHLKIIKGCIQTYPVWLPDNISVGMICAPPKKRSLHWKSELDRLVDIECRNYVFITKDYYNNQRIINPLGSPIVVPLSLEYKTVHPKSFSIFDPIFAGIKPRKTSYSDVIEWLHDEKIMKMIMETNGREYKYDKWGKIVGHYNRTL